MPPAEFPSSLSRGPLGAVVRFLADWLNAPSRRQRIAAVVLLVLLVATLVWQGSQPYAGSMFSGHWDKVAHLVVYGGFATLAWIAASPYGLAAALATNAAIGLLDEWAQAFSPGRMSSFADWATDMGAAIVVVLVLPRVRRWLLSR